MVVPQKWKTKLPYDPTIPLLGIYPKEIKGGIRTYLYSHIHSSIIHNSQKDNPSVHQWIDEQNVVYPYNRVLFRLKGGNFDKCYSTDETWRHYAKWKKPVTKGQIPYESSYEALSSQIHRDRK